MNDGIYSGNSLSILNSNFRLFASGIENVSPIERLASYDPVYRSDGDALYLNPDVPYTSTKLDGVLIPVCAAGAPNYGHYLFDGLGVAFMLAKLLPPGMVRLAGQGLKGWQKQIIDALGLSDVYVEVRGPVRFRKMVASTTLALHVTYPTAFARPVFDFMRFRFGSRERPRRNLFVSRRGMDHRFFANRDEIEILASSLGFDVVQPEQLPVADQVRLFASAKVVVGEAGAALANIGFCHPGTSVLEIQTAAFGDSWIRATCRIFGHRWHLFRAENIPPHTGQQMAFRVDPLEFRNAATAVLDGVGSRE